MELSASSVVSSEQPTLALVKSSSTDPTTLIECEAAIGFHLEARDRSAAEIGRVLGLIKEKRLYVGWETFEAYCADRWGYKKTYTADLINHSKIINQISEQSSAIAEKPILESHTRPLINVPPANRGEVWEAALASKPEGEAMTAKIVENAVLSWLNHNRPDIKPVVKAAAKAKPKEAAFPSEELPTIESPGLLSNDDPTMPAIASLTAGIAEPVEVAPNQPDQDRLTYGETDYDQPAIGFVGELTEITGNQFDFAYFKLEDLRPATIAKALTALQDNLGVGARFAVSCAPKTDYAFVKAAEKDGWVLEHSLIAPGEYPSSIKPIFWPRHQIILVFAHPDHHPLCAVDFESAIALNNGVLPSSFLTVEPLDILIAAFTKEGAEVLLPQAGLSDVRSVVAQNRIAHYLCDDLQELDQYRSAFGGGTKEAD